MQNQASQTKQRNNKSLMVGETVILADRFFANHQLEKREHGIGQIIDVTESPYITVLFAFNAHFVFYKEKGYIKDIKIKGELIRVTIHMVYLERMEVRRASKKKQNKDCPSSKTV